MKEESKRPSAINATRIETSSNNNSPRDSPRRRKETFITNVSSISHGPIGRVQQLYQQLNGVIDGMDIKIQDVINRHEAEFLLAYRNHMKKIKQELEDIRNKTANAEANSNSFDRITSLEKQLILFREEALKLYNNLEQKSRECEQYKLRLDESNSQNKFLENQVKKLMKRTKYLQAQFSQKSAALEEETSSIPEMPTRHTGTLPPSRRLVSRKIRTADTNRASLMSSNAPIQRLRSIVQDESLLNNIKEVILEAEEVRERKLQEVSIKYEKVLRHTSSNGVRINELEQFFFKCVETARKQVMKRTNNLNNYSKEYIDYQAFLKLDCLRVLELFVSNERVKNLIHAQMFARRTQSTSAMYNTSKLMPTRGKSSRPAAQNQSLRNAYSQFIE